MSETELAEMPEGSPLPETEAPVEEPQDETTPDVAGEPTDDDSEARPKPKAGFQQRISEVVAERNEARKRAEALERRLDELVELVVQPRQAAEIPQPVAPPQQPPMREQFEDDASYWQAAHKYVAATASLEARAEFARIAAEQQAAARDQSFRQREAEFAAQQSDYYETVSRPGLFQSVVMAQLIKESPIGPELAYHLARNVKAQRQLESQPPVVMARELGRIEARILAAKEAPKAPAKPPPPAPPPKLTAGEAVVETDPEKMPIEQFVSWRQKQIMKRRGST